MIQNNIKSLIEKYNNIFYIYLASRSFIGLACVALSVYLVDLHFCGRDIIFITCIVLATMLLTEVVCYVNTYIRFKPIALLMFKVEKMVDKVKKNNLMSDKKTQSVVLASYIDSLRNEMNNLNLSEQEIGDYLSKELLHRIHICTLLNICSIFPLVIYFLSIKELPFTIWIIFLLIISSIDTTNAVIILRSIYYPEKLIKESNIRRKMGYYIVSGRLPRRKNSIGHFIDELFLTKRSTNTYGKYLKKLSVIPERAILTRHCDDYLIYKYKFNKKRANKNNSSTMN